MEVILEIASSIDDVFSLIMGEGLPIPIVQSMEQYPYRLIR